MKTKIAEISHTLSYLKFQLVYANKKTPESMSVAKCRGSRVATKSRGSRVWVVSAGAGAGVGAGKKILKKR